MSPRIEPRLRWFQFRLRTLLWLTAVVACLLFVWRAYVEPYRRQRDTMRVIERLDGSYKTVAAETGLCRLLGRDVENIVLVNLADCDVPAEYIERIANLPRLETLLVGGTAFSDDHLRHLHRLKTLRRLLLDSTSITCSGRSAIQTALPDLLIYCSDRKTFAARTRPWSFYAPRAFAPDQWADLYGYLVAIVDASLTCEEDICDHDLQVMTRLHNLEELSLNGKGVDAALAYVEHLGQLEKLYLDNSPVGDKALANLRFLINLRELSLCETRVSDSGVAHLQGLKRLEQLDLTQTHVGDAGLACLQGMTNLRTLLLEGTRVGDAGLAHLTGCTSLEKLDLTNTPVGDAGLAHLRNLENVRSMTLDGTRVGDAGMAHLANWTPVEFLSLKDTGVGDDGMAYLQGVKCLYLDRTRVGDAGLRHLHRSPSLMKVSVHATQATERGVAALQKALPHCAIYGYVGSSE